MEYKERRGEVDRGKGKEKKEMKERRRETDSKVFCASVT
jgi:hypothetical protein